jgi:hypothetical protein
MVKVVRVETAMRVGMYSYRDVDNNKPACIYDMQSSANHPSPEEDAALSTIWNKLYRDGTHREWSFAFSDLKQLRNWIYRSEWRNELAGCGLMISVYEVEHYHLGDTQCIFRWENVKLVDRFGFDEIYTKDV